MGHGHLGKAVRDLPQKLAYLTFRYDVCRQGILIPETTQVLMVRVLSSNPVSVEAGVDTMNTMPALICLLLMGEVTGTQVVVGYQGETQLY